MRDREADIVSRMERVLRVDATTVRVVTALRGVGIEPILLKGRAFARELYDSPVDRPFADSDLLVRPSQFEEAEATLESIGFRRATPGLEETYPEWTRHAHDWIAPPPAVPVELHWTIVGACLENDALVGELVRHLRPISIGGVSLPTLHGSGTAWLASLHAAQHGNEDQPLRDLRRALERFGPAVWEEAADLAGRADSVPAFVTGLRLTAEGARLADTLDMAAKSSMMTELMASNAPWGALVLEEFARKDQSWSRSVQMVAGTLFVGPDTLRKLDPLARKRPFGLVAAYVRRPFLLAGRLVTAWRSWRAVRQIRARAARGRPV